MKSITQTTQEFDCISKSMRTYAQKYKFYSLLKKCGGYKSKGYSVISVFMYLFSVVFTNRSMYMNILHGRNTPEFGQDTLYRLLNSATLNWERFTALLAAKVAREAIVPLTNAERKNVFIIDDTTFERARATKVELLSKIFDHTDRRYKRGFRLLTLGWSDGNTFLPVSSRLLASSKQAHRYQEAKTELDKRTLAYRRRSEATSKATEVMLKLLDLAICARIEASYVLFDTWFASPSSILAVKSRGLDVIAMLKRTEKMHYLYQGKAQSVKQIYNHNKKRRGRSKYLLSVEIAVTKDGETVPARLVYVRKRNKRKDWLVLLSTDRSISEEEIIRLYGKRWDIEVFFKICKTHLRLAKECRGLSYDAMTAHVALVFSRYIMLAEQKRTQEDHRSLGVLFLQATDELSDITWEYSISVLLEFFMQTLLDKLCLSKKQLNNLMDSFIELLPPYLKKVCILRDN